MNRDGHYFNPTTQVKYDSMGNPIEETDENGKTTVKTYNIFGKPLTITYPDKTCEQFFYKQDGVTLCQSIGKNGLITKYDHDAFGRLMLKEEYVAGDKHPLSRETYCYNSYHLLEKTDAMGHTTKYGYDSFGRQISITTEDSRQTVEYDALGRIAKTRNFYGLRESEVSVTAYEYDLLNRIVEERIEDSQGNALRKTAYRYDQMGNRTHQINETSEGERVSITYFDELKRPIKVTDPLGEKTTYQYEIYQITSDKRVLRVTQTDPLKNLTITTMNELNRVGKIEKLDQNGKLLASKMLFYDGVGNHTKTAETVFVDEKEERQVVTHWDYDPMNVIAQIREAVGTSLEKAIRFTANDCGQLKAIHKPSGVTICHEYDWRGRLKIYEASDKSFSYEYGYDLNDNLVISKDLINKSETIRKYDGENRLIQEKLANGLILNYRYDCIGRMSYLELPNYFAVDYHHDAANLVEVNRLRYDGKTTTHTHHYVDYDKAGNLLEFQLMGAGGTVTHSYDLTGKPKRIVHSSWTEVIPDEGYDAVGNMVERILDDVCGKINCEYTYDQLYQLTSESGVAEHIYHNDSLFNRVAKDSQPYLINALNQLKTETEYHYDYDSDGNLVQKKHLLTGQEIKYTYDAQDRLTAVEDYDSRYEYMYDSFNRRLYKLYLAKEEGKWIRMWKQRYIYQDQNEIGMIDEKGNMLEMRILGGGKGAEIGATLFMEIEGRYYFPIHDHNGNIVTLLDESGNVVEAYRYTAYGEEQLYDRYGNPLAWSSVNNPWRFSSKRIDPETDFVYFGRRYYDPRIGRWLAPDPLGFEAGPNLYTYLMNGPLTRFDLYGLFDHDISESDYLMPTNYQDMRLIPELSAAGIEHTAGTFAGMALAGVSFGELMYADMAYDDDDTLFRQKSEAIGIGILTFGENLKSDPLGTLAPELMGAIRMPSDAFSEEHARAWGRAIAEAGMYAIPAYKGVRAVNSSKIAVLSSGSLKTMESKGILSAERGIIASPNINPLNGTKYTSKVTRQMEPSQRSGQLDFHGFPKLVDNSAHLGKKELITGRDGISRVKITLDGSYRGCEGHFEWIVENNNSINHRIFTPSAKRTSL